jgi:anti-sigma factor RsiW
MRVNCTEARDRLLEAAEGCLAGQELHSVEEHLARCEACRAEFEELRTASCALRDAVPELAPAQSYLTPDRRRRLMAAYAEGPKLFRLVTYRRFIALAAAAAILISAGAIVLNLGRPWHHRQDKTPVAVQLPQYLPVVLAAAGQGEPVSVFRSIPVSTEAGSAWDEPARGGRIVRADSAGVRIPVDHAYYDPEESSLWW